MNETVYIRIKAQDETTGIAKRATAAVKTLHQSIIASASKLKSGLGDASKKFHEHLQKNNAALPELTQHVSRFATRSRTALLDTIAVADQFNDKLALLNAESGGLATETLSKLSNSITALARKSRFSTDQMADGFIVLANQGFTAEQQMTSMVDITKLAQATGADLGGTITFVSKTLRGFGLDAKDTKRVVDVLRAGAGEAGLTIQEMGALMSKAAPRAKGLGASIEETTAIVAALGKAGIQGEQASAALNAFLANLAAQSSGVKSGLQQLEISAKQGPLAILNELAQKTARFSEKSRESGFAQMFSESGGFAIARLTDAIREGRVNLEDYTTQMEKSAGTVDRLAKITGGTGAAASEELNESWTELKRTVGEQLSPAMDKLRRGLAKLLDKTIEFAKANPGVVKGVAAVAAVLAGLASLLAGGLGLATTAAAITTVLPLLGALKVGALAVTAAMTPILLTALAVGAAIGAVTLAIQQLVKHWSELDVLEGLAGMAKSVFGNKYGAGVGVLSTLGQLFDPRTLLQDLGVMDKPGASSQRRIPAGAGTASAAASEVAGQIDININSEGRPKVKKLRAKGGVELGVTTGYSLAGSTGGL